MAQPEGFTPIFDANQQEGDHVDRLIENLLQHLSESLEWDIDVLLIRAIAEGAVLPAIFVRASCGKKKDFEGRKANRILVVQALQKFISL
jgi:hypothetical protein